MAIIEESRFKYGLAIISGGFAAMLAALTFIPMPLAAKIVLLSLAGANIALSGYMTTIAIKQDRYEKKKAAAEAVEKAKTAQEVKANQKGKTANQEAMHVAAEKIKKHVAAKATEQSDAEAVEREHE